MPTYPYACTACDNRFEVVQAFSDDALTVCDVCGGRLRKVFSSVGVVFKGSGFYRNDSRGSGSSESAGDTKVSAPAASGDGAKTSSDTATPATPAKTETAKPTSTPSSSSSSSSSKESAA